MYLHISRSNMQYLYIVYNSAKHHSFNITVHTNTGMNGKRSYMDLKIEQYVLTFWEYFLLTISSKIHNDHFEKIL